MRFERHQTQPGPDHAIGPDARGMGAGFAGWPERATRAFVQQVPGGADPVAATEALTTRLEARARVQGIAAAEDWAADLRGMILSRQVAVDSALWTGRRVAEAVLPLPVDLKGNEPVPTPLVQAVVAGAPLALEFGAPGASGPRVALDLRCFVEAGAVSVDALERAVRAWALALVVAAGPGRRPGAMILAGLGGALMRLGLGYATPEGRAAAMAMAALAEAARWAVAVELGLDAGAAPIIRQEPDRVPAGAQAALLRARALAAVRRDAPEATGKAPMLMVAPLGSLAAILGLGDDPLAPVSSLRLDAERPEGHVGRPVPELEAGLAAQCHAPDRIAAAIRHAIGHGTLVAAPGIDHAALRAFGIDGDRIARIEAALAEARDLRAVVTPWRLGPDFCRDQLGIDPETLSDHGMGLLERLGFDAARIDAANWHVFGTGTLRGAPGLSPETAVGFDCAETVGPRPRLAMAAALASVLSGPVRAPLAFEGTEAEAGLDRAIRAARRAGIAALLPQRLDAPGEIAARLREILAMLPEGIRPGTAPSEVLELLDAAGRSRPDARRHARDLRARLLAEPWSGQDAAAPSRTGVRGMERLRPGGVADP
ncbi:hypothetical protein T8T21_01340 [Limimaricola variabilis]|uniref:hypothetical protein n=1 Tax=Limimaricola variabilis TaxID=1492771 RepID=UPI002AC98057|nr:hypothetical protein [Limimaricola variabilis]WPY94798.1 hypothetical protein T8T21_01340 [Limimaricola variabilis]